MTQFDQNFWNERYQNDETRWDLGTVSPPIAQYTQQLPNKNISILIPGCGNTYEAAYLYFKTKQYQSAAVTFKALLKDYPDIKDKDKIQYYIPPFGGNIDEYRQLFSPYFRLKHISPCYNSYPARQGTELFIELEKI